MHVLSCLRSGLYGLGVGLFLYVSHYLYGHFVCLYTFSVSVFLPLADSAILSRVVAYFLCRFSCSSVCLLCALRVRQRRGIKQVACLRVSDGSGPVTSEDVRRALPGRAASGGRLSSFTPGWRGVEPVGARRRGRKSGRRRGNKRRYHREKTVRCHPPSGGCRQRHGTPQHRALRACSVGGGMDVADAMACAGREGGRHLLAKTDGNPSLSPFSSRPSLRWRCCGRRRAAAYLSWQTYFSTSASISAKR